MQTQESNSSELTIYYLSEQAVAIEFGQGISEAFLTQIKQVDDRIHQKPFPGFRTTVPAYTTLSVFFDPVEVIKSQGLQGTDCFEKVSWYLNQLKNEPVKEASALDAIITVPVCYGDAFGPDLDEVTKIHNLTAAEVIRLHCSVVYKVYMIGFVPGFAYLGGMPELLATPRKPTPRKAIPAGAVGIAGKQTGVYPLETPGGWQIIGRTPLTLFNALRPQPTLLKAGDSVLFNPVTHHEFKLIANKPYADTHY